MKFEDQVVEWAKSQIGQTEISGNQGFDDERFQHLMVISGWKKGEAWCSYFAELCWTVPVYEGKSIIFTKLTSLFSGSTQTTYLNFKSRPDLFQISMEAKRGALMIMRKHISGKPHWSGHAGIVSEVHNDYIKTIEGNTNASGGREGIEVAEMTRQLDTAPATGLRIRGFIYPKL